MRTTLALLLLLGTGAAHAAPVSAEQGCTEAVAAARLRLATLPEGDLSRRFAENDLAEALIEMHAGEPDECPALVQRALRTIEFRPYRLRPGETVHGYGVAD